MDKSKLPPKFVYDKVRQLRKLGMSDKEISKKLKIRLSTIQGITENAFREMIRTAIRELIDNPEEIDEMSTTGGVAGYQTPAAFVGKGGKARKVKWHKDVTNSLGYETVWDEEDADELGPNAKKRSNYVGTNESINESKVINEDQRETLVNHFFKTWAKDKLVQKKIKSSSVLQKNYGKYLTYSRAKWDKLTLDQLNKLWTDWSDVDYVKEQSTPQDFGNFGDKRPFSGTGDTLNEDKKVKVKDMKKGNIYNFGGKWHYKMLFPLSKDEDGDYEIETEILDGPKKGKRHVFNLPPTFKGYIMQVDNIKENLEMTEGRYGAYQMYRDDESKNAHQKIGESIKRMRANLKELTKEVALNLRLKSESGVDSEVYWKRTRKDLAKVTEHLFNLIEAMRRF